MGSLQTSATALTSASNSIPGSESTVFKLRKELSLFSSSLDFAAAGIL